MMLSKFLLLMIFDNMIVVFKSSEFISYICNISPIIIQYSQSSNATNSDFWGFMGFHLLSSDNFNHENF